MSLFKPIVDYIDDIIVAFTYFTVFLTENRENRT